MHIQKKPASLPRNSDGIRRACPCYGECPTKPPADLADVGRADERHFVVGEGEVEELRGLLGHDDGRGGVSVGQPKDDGLAALVGPVVGERVPDACAGGVHACMRGGERERERERETGREREEGREGGREGGIEGEREREGGREGGIEGEREREGESASGRTPGRRREKVRGTASVRAHVHGERGTMRGGEGVKRASGRDIHHVAVLNPHVNGATAGLHCKLREPVKLAAAKG